MKKTIALILSLIMVCACLAGCGSKPAEEAPKAEAPAEQPAAAAPVEIDFLVGSQAMYDWFHSFFPELVSGENEHNIIVNVEFQAEATQILQMKASTNEVPDMLCVGLPQEMIREGYFLDLSEGVWWDNTMPSTKDIARDVSSGNIYTVPMGSGAVGIFYNKDMMAQLGVTEMPTTWAEYEALLERVKNELPGVTPMYLGGKESWSLGHIIDFNLMGVAKADLGYVGYETAMAGNDLEALAWNANEDGALAVFGQNIMNLKAKGLINENAVTATTDNLAEAFATGKAAFVSQGMWALSTFQEKNPDFKAIGFMAYPAIMPDAPATVGGPLEGSIALSAKSAPEEIEAAKIVLALMTGPEANKSYCEATGTIPVRTNVDADWSFIKDDVKAVLSSAVAEMYTQNLPGGFSSDENGRLVQNILVDKYTSSVEFAQDYLDMWNQAYSATN